MNIKNFAKTEGDTPEITFRKILTLWVSATLCCCGLAWTAMYYFIFGWGQITALPLIFFIVVGSSIFIAHFLRNYLILLYTFLFCITWITALIQWSIGSITNSGCVVIWSFLGPIGATIFLSRQQAILFMGMFLTILITSIVFEPAILGNRFEVSVAVRNLFYIMNIGMATAVVFAASLWFVIIIQREKQHSHELLISQQAAFKQLKEAQSQIVQSEKMASLGQLTAGVAHEINNPINFVLSNINPLSRDIDDMIEFINADPAKVSDDLKYSITESKQLLEGITDGAKRIAEIVSGLRSFSRLSETEKKKVNLNDGINSCLLLIRNHLKEKNIEVELALGNIPELACYPGELNQVFLNLINNAFDSITKKGKITITTATENNLIKIAVKDNGNGMTNEIQQKIFDPFFTTKDVGKGTGLGLSVAFGIIKNHDGSIEVNSKQNMGSEFIIKLPYC